MEDYKLFKGRDYNPRVLEFISINSDGEERIYSILVYNNSTNERDTENF